MLGGNFCIGIGVGCLRLSRLGVDAFSCMNLGVGTALGWTFGNWQLLVNAFILVFVFFAGRSCIGLGTLVNMTAVGYMADAICVLFGAPQALPVRAVLMALGVLLCGIGVGAYMAADMGLSPYDSVGVLIERATRGRMHYGKARILSDVTVVIVGTTACWLSGQPIENVLGVGTLCMAFLTGPLAQIFKTFFQNQVKLHRFAG